MPPLRELFAEPGRPLHLDIGSARGRFLLAMAPLHPERNHLGVEIRRPLVEAAEADRLAAGLANLRFLYANANVSLEEWLAALPPDRLALVTLQFPDPWFKKRHHKRRVLQPSLLLALAAALPPGGEFFLQSDVAAVMEPMVALVEASGCFTPAAGAAHHGPDANPLPVPTERELHVLRRGLPVHRRLYRRTSAPLPSRQTLEDALRHADNPGDAPAA
ncbi:MAG: tRNA (guanosine(46)-N7)-methyltransferase TrmB [Synechococcaceae cyanobacterium]|nr:tRNA (guanosine(46)-N7)-methyltransferase TrmB [Synechococcaceae cyanobacterium]